LLEHLTVVPQFKMLVLLMNVKLPCYYMLGAEYVVRFEVLVVVSVEMGCDK
jgi:hypothetical protein